MITLTPGQTCINKHDGSTVTIVEVTEQKLRLRTITGFEYEYNYFMFLTEYETA